jgi:hypothetical protein
MAGLIGILVVAAVATAGDYLWYEIGVEHRTLHGVLHGAALLTAVGGVLGASAGRFVGGLPLGAAAGVAGALAYYALRPALGGYGAMIAAWASLWLMLALFDGLLLRRPRRGLGEIAARGLIAAVAGGLAFYGVVATLWGDTPGVERNYFKQFAAWAMAWAPGILALTIGRNDKSPT